VDIEDFVREFFWSGMLGVLLSEMKFSVDVVDGKMVRGHSSDESFRRAKLFKILGSARA